MHIEDEAKTKWCPFARVVAVTDELPYMAGNRVKNHLQWPVETTLNPETARCIGSACMAWRPIMTCETVIGERDKKPEGDGWEWDTFSDDRWERPVTTGKGYCGLAGRPA